MKSILFPVLFLFVIVEAFASSVVSVKVDADVEGREVNRFLYGINTAHWDESLFPGPAEDMLLTADREAISLIRKSGVTLLKYPGGNAADSYIWNSEENPVSEMDTDEYMALCRAVGAEPFITVNFNASPELAAEWVRYCNVRKDYNVRLWELGDEQWGSWARGHGSPEAYAEKFVEFVAAMRAVDPTILVAMNVPLGPRSDNWTERVLKVAGDEVDMLTFTYFPLMSEQESDEALLASVEPYRRRMEDLRRRVEGVLGVERAEEILYVNLGYNSVSHSPGPQTLEVVNALWVADLLGAMAESGTDIGCFWAIHNAYPPRGGDYGYLSSDGRNLPSYSYYVFPMFTELFGERLVRAVSDDPELSVYASRDEGRVAVFLINKNREDVKTVEISLAGFGAGEVAEVSVLDERRRNERLGDLPVEDGVLRMEIGPYAFVAVNFREKGYRPEPLNLALEAKVTASSFSEIGPHFGPESAVDGNRETRWDSEAWLKSKGDERQWLQLEWGEPKVVSSVRIVWGASFGVDYLLEVSVDGEEWEVLERVESGVGGIEEFRFAPVEIRFLRMKGNRGTDAISAYSIAEIEVFGE